MADEWIKVRRNLGNHPKIVRMMSALLADKFRTVGGLHAVWSVFDEFSEDGILNGYSASTMDQTIGWPGFCGAMVAVGWLVDTGESLEVPEFDEHNGASGKRRAQDAKAKRKRRNLSASHADILTKNCGLEEEREVDKKKEPPISPAGDRKAADPRIDEVQPVVDAYHAVLPKCQRITVLNDKRRKRILAVVKIAKGLCKAWECDYDGADFFTRYFEECAKDPWKRGEVAHAGNPRWKQNIDVLLAEDRFAETIDKAFDGQGIES